MTKQTPLPFLSQPYRHPSVASPLKTVLDQERLNVTAKTRSNIFNWRGQFTPQFVDYLIDRLAPRASAIVDPFCGSGTVLLESASKGIAAYGTELHPAAYAMAKFSTLCALSAKDRHNLCRAVEAHLDAVAVDFDDCPLWNSSPNFRNRTDNLLSLGKALLDRSEGKLQTLFSVLVLCEAESARTASLLAAVRRAHRWVADHLARLPSVDTPPRVFWCDARRADKAIGVSCDLLITSPPYINVFNYHQNHRALVELLGFDVLRFAQSEIGSNRRNRRNRFRTVVQYALDMEQCLHVFNRLLAPGGTAVVIVGRESRIRGVPFRNGDIIFRLAKRSGAMHLQSTHERQYVNRFGMKIIEDVLILRKRSNPSSRTIGRSVAEHALKNALPSATGHVRADIVEAITALPTISESPLLDTAPAF